MAATGHNIRTTSDTISFRDQTTGMASISFDHATETLTISHDGTGVIAFGDTSSDIFLGDGVTSVDLIMEVDGAIKGDTDVTLTLGSTDSDILIASPTVVNNNFDITGTLGVTGDITMGGETVLTGITSGDITGALGYTPLSSETDDQTLDEVLAQGNTSTRDISVGAITGSALTIDTDTLFVDATNNRVGIGTTSPSAPLHIDGGSESEVLKIEADSNPFIRWVQNGTNVGFLQFTGGVAYLSNMGNGSFHFRTNNTDKMTITSGGDVGIGDTTPSYKLDVNGTLRAVGAAYFNNDVVVTNNLTLTGADKPTFSTPDDTVYTPSDNWVTATPFNAAWHDLIAFDRNYTTTQEISTDGTNFSSDTLELGLFDQKDKTRYEVVGNGERAVRWTWTGVSYNSGRYFHIAAGYSSPAPSCTVKIETSSDGSTWTEIHSSSGITFSATNRFYAVNPRVGASGHNYVRLTIDKGNTDTKTIHLTSIKMLTQRLGDQGKGREDELPFYYDKNQNIGIGTTSPVAKLELKGSTADSTASAFVVRDSASAALFSIRNDGRIDATGNIVVTGDLTVNGTTTTINSTTVQVDDKNIELGTVASPTDTTADGGGITLKGATDKTINWVNSTSSWTSNQTFSAPNLTLTSLSTYSGSDVTALMINGSNIVGKRTLGSAAFSATGDFATASHNHTLDSLSNVTITSNTSGEILKWSGSAWVNNTLSEAGICPTAGSTSLTTVGTISTGTWNGSVIASAYLDADTAHLSGTQTFSGVKTFSATVDIAQDLRHSGDTDTYLRMSDDLIRIVAGNIDMIRFTESTQNSVVINEGGNDVDFRFESDTLTHALFIEGSSGNVGIGSTAPDKKLVVRGADSEVVIDDTNSTPVLRFRNNGTTAGYIITNSSQDMKFHTGGISEAVIINSSGNVGIGTTSPSYKLEVAGQVQTHERLRIGSGGDNQDGELRARVIRLANDTGNSTAKISSTGAYGRDLIYHAISHNLRYYQYTRLKLNQTEAVFNDDGADVDFRVESDTDSNALFVQGSNGNVGIGTNSPTQLLHLSKQVHSGDVQLLVENSGYNAGTKSSLILKAKGTSGVPVTSGISNIQEGTTAGTLAFFTNGANERMRITTAGNVGIGTTSPSSKLEVDGDITVLDGNRLILKSTGGTYTGYIEKDSYNATVSLGLQTTFTNARKIRINDADNNGRWEFGGNTTASTDNIIVPLSPYSGSSIYAGHLGNIGFYTKGSTWSANVMQLFDRTGNSDHGVKLIYQSGGTYYDGLMLDNTGNVGIGTTSPSAKLEVNGHFAATTKSFIIDNPKTGGKLQYGVVESDQHSVLVRGKNDTHEIELPEEWEWLVDPDSVTVDLTSIGQIQQLFVISQDNKKIKIGGLAINGQYNYTVYGERVDVDKLQVNV